MIWDALPECKHHQLTAGLGRQCRGPSLFLFPALPSFLLPAAAVPTEPSPPSSISCPASTSFFTDKTEAISKAPPLLLNASAPVHLAVFLYSAFLPGPPPSEGPHCPAPRSLAGSAFPLFGSPFSRLLCLFPLAPPSIACLCLRPTGLTSPPAGNKALFSSGYFPFPFRRSLAPLSSRGMLRALPHLLRSFSAAPSLLEPSSSPFSCRLPQGTSFCCLQLITF